MSSRSSISASEPPKIPAQVSSTPRTPRIYTQRKLSSARRVRDMRSLPEYDSRSLLADPLKAYSQPDVLYEEKVKLTQEIDALLAEVVPLREQTELISNQFDEPDRNPLEEVKEIELRQKIESYQNEIEMINKSLSRFEEVFTTKNEEELKGQIQESRHEKSVLEQEIEELQKQRDESSDKNEDMKYSPSVDIVADNNQRIADLQKLLDDLKKEEADLLAEHEKLLISEPSDSSKSSQLGPYIRQLQQLQHIRTKRSVELKKAERSYKSQVQFMEAVKADKQKKDRERKRREAWNESFKSRMAANEESQRRIEESRNGKRSPKLKQNNNNNDTIISFYEEEEKVEYETIKRIVRYRHKHKRYHHKQHNEEEELIPLPNPLMFSTEVEKTDTLHITQPQKQEDNNQE